MNFSFWRKIGPWVLLGLLFLIIAWTWLVIFSQTPRAILRVSFLDVGQGDAVLIETPERKRILFDTGVGQRAFRSLDENLSLFNRSLALVLISHFDQDHGGIAPDLVRRFSLGSMMWSGSLPQSQIKKEIEKIGNLSKLSLSAGDSLRLGKEIWLDILWPPAGYQCKDDNDCSLVGRLRFRQTSLLLTGDLPAKDEQKLIFYGRDFLKSDVLKVGHHGSAGSNGADWLSIVRPKIAIISVGADNRYGHPAERVLEDLAKIKTTIYRTDREGTIVLESDGREWRKR